jgi:4-hydroxy-tetrahydrodipicolinate reductase
MPAIALLGATGRMGRALVRAVGERPEFKICGALASANSRHLGEDIGVVAGGAPVDVRVTSDLAAALKAADVAIDFALAGNLEERARAVGAAGCAWVLGTTGLSTRQMEAVDTAAGRVAVIASPNMSVGVQLLFKLVDAAARTLAADYDIEIFEAHHGDKVDAPSGTARRLGEVAAAARGVRLAQAGEFNRASAPGPRKRGSIGFSVARGGDIIGDHRVTFAGLGEQLVLEHRANDRMTYARGAVAAAKWLAGRPAGRYEMTDIIFYKQ